jgi:hypothetical protein
MKLSPPCDLLAPQSRARIASDEEVRIAGNHPERPKIGKETQLESDWARVRDREEEEENEAAAAQVTFDQHPALQAARAREQWHHRWLEWALETLPWGVPDEYRLEVRQEVEKTLESLQPQTPESLTRKLLEGAVQKGLRPWRNAKDVERVLESALGMLPWSARSFSQPTKWQIRAGEEANSAIYKLPDGVSFEAKLAAATAAVQKVALEFEEQTLRQKIIDESILFPLLSSAENEDARAAIRIGVESCRPGSSEAELRRARRAALKSFEDTQKQRELRQRLERKVDQGLDHIRPFLDELWREDELEGFESRLEVWNYAAEIRDEVRAGLLDRLDSKQEVSDFTIKTMIEDLVDELLLD